MTAALTSRPAPLTRAPLPGPAGATRPAATLPETGRVLVLVGDALTRRALDDALRCEGLSVRATTDAASAEVLVRSYRPSVLLVDAGHLHTALAQEALGHPELRLVVHGADAATRVAALRDGADDAAAPDCTPVEIALRCAALARRPERRPGAASATQWRIGRVMVDVGRRTISVDGHDVGATRLEFDLFATLCRRPTEVCSRLELIESVWGPRWVGDPHVVDVHLSNLRRKAREHAPDLTLLCTVRGVGFRLSDDVTLNDVTLNDVTAQA